MNHTTIAILAWILVAFNWSFVIIDLVRGHVTPGTRFRYILATAEWAMALPAFIFPALVIIAGRPWTGSFNFLTCVYVLYQLYKDGDDNWFQRKRRQLKQYFTVTRLQLAGSRA